MGYIVVPPALVDVVKPGKALIDRRTASMPQRVLADFISEGHFHRHVKRTRELYNERRQVLLDAVRSRLSGGLEPGPFNAGMQIALAFQSKVDDVEFSKLAAERNLSVLPLSICYASSAARWSPPASGLLLGFACVPPSEIREGATVLQQMLEANSARA
ncbi:aminotransferase class I/II-fold pyridoxal phosphate-dependent enzyme [Ralstonia sp. 24A2]|uniref:aminotransferase class I/II-fold pyridoxal phosphate-dependent enzyme n=1 Tax=Ralstonia sp. 24A2 TaxID=3447364 RepID=UPI003F69B4F2